MLAAIKIAEEVSRLQRKVRCRHGNSSFWLALSVAGLLACSLMPCTSRAEEGVIRFGASLALTGVDAKLGRLTRDGYDFYARKLNALGGLELGGKRYRIEIVYYDDESNIRTATRLVEKLITEEGIRFILGPYGSGATYATSAITEKHGAIMLEANGAADKIFARGFRNLFATLTTASQYFASVLEAAAGQTPRPRTVAFICENDLFAKESMEGGVRAAEDMGYEVVFAKTYPKGAKDISSLLTLVKVKQPDILLGSGHIADSILLVRQAKDLNLCPKMLGSTVGPPVPDFVNSLKEDAEYVVAPTQWHNTLAYSDPLFGDAAQYTKEFEETYGYSPDYHAAQSTAAMIAYGEAIKRAGGLDVERVRDALAELDIMTFFGPIRFNEQGMNVAKRMAVLQIQGGERRVVWPPEVAEAPLLYPKPPWK